jgi:hypothetical protein
MAPDDIVAREARRVLAVLAPDDRETMEALVHLERRRAAANVEWIGTILGFLALGAALGVVYLMGTWIYAESANNLLEARRAAVASDERARVVERRCLDKFAADD